MSAVAQGSGGYVNASKMCQDGGKTWSNYIKNHTSKAFITNLEKSLKVDRNSLIVSRSTGPYALRGTMVHPEIAKHLTHWVKQTARKTDVTSMVYLVTSPILRAVKIGYWSGDIKGLRQRYQTLLGHDMWIAWVEVDDGALAEKRMHKTFAKERFSHELFDKQKMRAYLTELRKYGKLQIDERECNELIK